MKLEIIKEIDTKEKRWCDSAALVYVKGGKQPIDNRYFKRIMG